MQESCVLLLWFQNQSRLFLLILFGENLAVAAREAGKCSLSVAQVEASTVDLVNWEHHL